MAAVEASDPSHSPEFPEIEGEDDSLRNGNRENRTSFELFLLPFLAWNRSTWDLAVV